MNNSQHSSIDSSDYESDSGGPPAAKRTRSDTLGASSHFSHSSSVALMSDSSDSESYATPTANSEIDTRERASSGDDVTGGFGYNGTITLPRAKYYDDAPSEEERTDVDEHRRLNDGDRTREDKRKSTEGYTSEDPEEPCKLDSSDSESYATPKANSKNHTRKRASSGNDVTGGFGYTGTILPRAKYYDDTPSDEERTHVDKHRRLDEGDRTREDKWKSTEGYTSEDPKEPCKLDSRLRSLSESDDQSNNYRGGFGLGSQSEHGATSDGGSSINTPTVGDIFSGGNYPVMKMMNKMGWAGQGLGKFGQGRVVPVEASKQKGRRGLGLMPSTLGEGPKDYKYEPETAVAEENVMWLPTPPDEELTADILDDWVQRGPKTLSIENETNFCEPNILKGVLAAKTVFDTLDQEDLRRARTKSNPYETIGAMFFLNRAAVKMANLDAVFDFMFTNPKTPDGKPVIDTSKELLYFADVCAGPGGFSEYVLWRKKWMAKGFGFTLKGSNDFKLSDFYAGPPETFCPYYGVAGDGDVYNPDNLESLKTHVLGQTDDLGVHFLMADGGFSVDGQENLQEVLSKQLYLCQCLAAMMLVRTGGHFVVKLFDIFTPFSVGLIYLMYRSFDQVSIHKPHTSRPANSERYLICKWKRSWSHVMERHLFRVNRELWKAREAQLGHEADEDTEDIVELVPFQVMKDDVEFYNYIYNSNNMLGERQINSLLKLAAFCKDKNLSEPLQIKMRQQCLQLWKVPDEVRKAPARCSPDDALSSMVGSSGLPERRPIASLKQNTLSRQPAVVTDLPDLKNIKSVYDWHFMFLNNSRTDQCKFYLGLGGHNVYQLNGSHWTVSEFRLELPSNTLLYGEIVKELCGEHRRQSMTRALHVLDAVCLGGVSLADKHLTDRQQMCQLFCSALHKPFREETMALRCKRLMDLQSLSSSLEVLEFRQLKNGQRALAVPIHNRMEHRPTFHVMNSVLFMKATRAPWVATISRKTEHKYFYKMNSQGQCKSEYIKIPEACLDTIGTYSESLIWHWEPPSLVFERKNTSGLTRTQLEEFVESKSLKISK